MEDIPDKALAGLAQLRADAAQMETDLEVEVEAEEPERVEPPIVETEAPEEEPPKDEELEKPEPKKKSKEDEEYGERVNKRIKREQAVTAREREARLLAEKEAAELKVQLAKVQTTKEIGDFDVAIKTTQDKLREARIAVDYDAEAAAQAELSELYAKKTIRAERAAEAPPPKVEPQLPVPKPEQQRLVLSWMGRNKWFSDEKYAAEARLAVALNNDVANDGFSDDDPEFYKELDRRIEEKIRLPEKPKPAPSPVDSGRSDLTGTKPGKVVLSKRDLEVMAGFGLDTKNPAALKEFALQKMEPK